MFDNGGFGSLDDFNIDVLKEYPLNSRIVKTVIPVYEITYKDDTGFGVYVVEDENENSFSIKGTFISQLVLGQTYKVEGIISSYRGEKQINVTTIRNVKPINERGIIAYLQTLKGLKSRAYLIYEKFGSKSIDILMENPMLVAESIKGIGKKSVMSWKTQLDKMKESQYAMTSLLSYGLTLKQAKKLYDKYGDDIVTKIAENPYFLSWEVRGYGFERCDRIARNIGFDLKSPFRIHEGIVHVLERASTNGNCYLPKDEFIDNAVELLTVKLSYQEMVKFASEMSSQKEFDYFIGEKKYVINYNKMMESLNLYKNERNKRKRDSHRYTVIPFSEDEILEQLIQVQYQNRVVVDGDKIYLKNLYEDEVTVAERVCVLAVERPFKKSINLEKELDDYLTANNIELEDRQREAVLEFSKSMGGFFILNGSAGCGKTFTLKIILKMLEKQYRENGRNFDVKVFAPTGKASKVASKATGLNCMTVHRGLGYNPQFGFQYNETNPLDADCVVVDESSMMDITLTKYLLNAISNGTKVIFLGDTKQLPSVGPGNVLHDLINSNIVKIVTLNVVKRQGSLSGIIRNANKIIAREMISSCEDTKDAYVIYRSTIQGVQKTIIECMHRILKMDGYSLDDIQLLCPQKTSLIGTYYMNYLLQKEFNKNNSEYKVPAKKFQVQLSPIGMPEIIQLYFLKGDKVIHTKNNYDMEWYTKTPYGYVKDTEIIGITNGECGVIEDIVKIKIEGEDRFRIIVKYEDKYVFYDDGFDELEHAYALTIHKSQGSQWKAIIIPIMKQNFIMLDNNLFYTGYTRAENFEVTIGQPEALDMAIKTHRLRNRYTSLTGRILQLLN